MVTKVHGVAGSGESLTGNIDFYTVRTLLDITTDPNADPSDVSQDRLDFLIESISMRAQPIIIGAISQSTETVTAGYDLPAAGPTGTTGVVDTIKFACEHHGAVSALELLSLLNGHKGFVSTTPTTGNNVSCVENDLL